MTDDLPDNPDREAQRNEVLLAYVEARQAGREPDRTQLLAAHPSLRDELEEFFQNFPMPQEPRETEKTV